MMDEIFDFLLELFGDRENDEDVELKIKEVEKCKLDYELKKLRRR